MKRREFVKLCASAVAGVSASPELLGEDKRELHFYERVALIDGYNHEPVRASSLEVGETYLFHYPFVSTPCFLIDLGQPVTNRENLETRDGEHYRWPSIESNPKPRQRPAVPVVIGGHTPGGSPAWRVRTRCWVSTTTSRRRLFQDTGSMQ